MAIVLAAALAAALARRGASFLRHVRPTKTLTLKGTVKTFQWTNPHVVIWVLVQPEGGGAPQEWTHRNHQPGRADPRRLDPPIRSSRAIASASNFSPLRDGSHGGGLNSVTLLDTGQNCWSELRRGEARPAIDAPAICGFHSEQIAQPVVQHRQHQRGPAQQRAAGEIAVRDARKHIEALRGAGDRLRRPTCPPSPVSVMPWPENPCR